MKEIFSVRTMAEVAIFAALGYVLDFLAGVYSQFAFVNGGSIGIALVCVFIISFRRGTIPGIMVGLIMGLLDLADGFYGCAYEGWKLFLQIGLDYWIAYPLAGLAGLLRKKVINAKTNKEMAWYLGLGCFLGGMLKFASHYLSGILFWPSDPWNVGGAYIYSLLYNGAYMLPCIILSTALVIYVGVRFPSIFKEPDSKILKSSQGE
jgi:thiamine transporter